MNQAKAIKRPGLFGQEIVCMVMGSHFSLYILYWRHLALEATCREGGDGAGLRVQELLLQLGTCLSRNTNHQSSVLWCWLGNLSLMATFEAGPVSRSERCPLCMRVSDIILSKL